MDLEDALSADERSGTRVRHGSGLARLHGESKELQCKVRDAEPA
jgi:hypothetical protein